MPRNRVPYAVAGALFALLALRTTPASAEFFGCEDQHRPRHVAYNPPLPAYANHYAQSQPPRITIYPRHHVTRHCRSWLAKEYRLSGTVIVPHQQCWWQ